MIMIVEKEQKQVNEVIGFFEFSKKNKEIGLINYTVRPCLVKAQLLNEDVKVPLNNKVGKHDYVILVDFATYIISLGDKNDSPGGKFISDEEHVKNCDRIIKELKELL